MMLHHTTFASVPPVPPNEPPRVAIVAPPSPPSERDARLVLHFFRTLYHFFPGFEQALKEIPDKRQPNMVDYPLPALLKAAMLLFLLKLKSRCYYNDLRQEENWSRNLLPFLHTATVPHGDTIADALEKIELAHLEALRTKGLKSLLDKRSLERFRLLDRYYMIAFDGTGLYTFKQRHCPHCLTKTCKTKDGKEYTIYYHSVLEAKLITTNGLAFSIGTEFIDNNEPNASKQDCELKAFYRLLPRLRQDYRRLPIVLLLDSLFAGAPTFALCKKLHCHFIVTFKEGSIPSVETEFQSLLPLQPQNRLRRTCQHEGRTLKQALQWVNSIDYEGHSLDILEQIETDTTKATRFKWLTDLTITQANCLALANEGGRCRWKIENQGFNIQKCGEFELEHAYSLHPMVWKLFYLLLQITHNWEQCVLSSETFVQLKPAQGRTRRGLFERLRSIFVHCILDWPDIFAAIAIPCQIRWDTS
jgi:hypothetical protein